MFHHAVHGYNQLKNVAIQISNLLIVLLQRVIWSPLKWPDHFCSHSEKDSLSHSLLTRRHLSEHNVKCLLGSHGSCCVAWSCVTITIHARPEWAMKHEWFWPGWGVEQVCAWCGFVCDADTTLTNQKQQIITRRHKLTPKHQYKYQTIKTLFSSSNHVHVHSLLLCWSLKMFQFVLNQKTSNNV